MNNTFNYTRFRNLLRKYTVENYRSYLMSVIVLGGVIALAYIYIFITGEYKIGHGGRIGFFFVFYLFGGTIFTSTVFSDYSNKERALVSLLLPASHFEKFLVGWVYSLLVYTGVFLIVFLSIDLLFMKAGRHFESDKTILNVFSHESKPYMVFFTYLLLHSIMLYGAILFKNLHFIKTALVFFVILILTIFLNKQLLKLLIDDRVLSRVPFLDSILVISDNGYTSIQLDPSENFYQLIILYAVTPILWIAAFFQFKEKQI